MTWVTLVTWVLRWAGLTPAPCDIGAAMGRTAPCHPNWLWILSLGQPPQGAPSAPGRDVPGGCSTRWGTTPAFALWSPQPTLSPVGGVRWEMNPWGGGFLQCCQCPRPMREPVGPVGHRAGCGCCPGVLVGSGAAGGAGVCRGNPGESVGLSPPSWGSCSPGNCDSEPLKRGPRDLSPSNVGPGTGAGEPGGLEPQVGGAGVLLCPGVCWGFWGGPWAVRPGGAKTPTGTEGPSWGLGCWETPDHGARGVLGTLCGGSGGS